MPKTEPEKRNEEPSAAPVEKASSEIVTEPQKKTEFPQITEPMETASPDVATDSAKAASRPASRPLTPSDEKRKKAAAFGAGVAATLGAAYLIAKALKGKD
jgi:hypothetical protein